MLSLARRQPEVKFVWQQFPYAGRQLEIFLDYIVCMLQVLTVTDLHIISYHNRY
jgi:hypothetical protein